MPCAWLNVKVSNISLYIVTCSYIVISNGFIFLNKLLIIFIKLERFIIDLFLYLSIYMKKLKETKRNKKKQKETARENSHIK